jgi:hypothetical protein
MEIERLADLLAGGDSEMEENMPVHLRQNYRFATVCSCVKSATFRAALQ